MEYLIRIKLSNQGNSNISYCENTESNDFSKDNRNNIII